MNSEAPSKSNKNISSLILVGCALLWTLSWVLPWTTPLAKFPWVRLFASVLIFIVPGMAISLLLAGQRFNLLTHFTSGLAVSVFLISILGFIGRVIHTSFEPVKIMFAMIGVIGLILVIKKFHSGHPLYKPEKFSAITLVLLPILILGFNVSFLNKNGGLGGDNFTYLAYLTNWQHAQPLDFKEIIYGSGTADWIRFWLTLFPMTTALLADISHLHGILLLGLYLEPCFVVIALLSIYNLYEDLTESKYLAIAAILLHFAFFFFLQGSLQTGGMFFHRTSEDKAFAAFILAPMFFLSIRFLLEKFTWKSILFFFLIGTSLEFTHPVILAYSVFIAGFYEGIVTISQRNYRKFIITSALLVLLILPSASLRFINAPWVSKNLLGLQYDLRQPGSFDLDAALHTGSINNRIFYIEGTPFYGFTPEKIQLQIGTGNHLWGFLSWSYLWILIIGLVWSLFNTKKHPVAPFITAACLLILVCLIPYTGWLVGYLVSARLLWRAPWLFPIGLVSVVLLTEIIKFIYCRTLSKANLKISVEQIIFGLVFVVSLFMIGYFLKSTNQNWYASTTINQNIKNMSDMAKLGEYIEKEVKQPSTFIADTQAMENLLPGLSSKAKIIYFRNSALSPYPINMNEIGNIFSLDPSITLDQRIDTLKKHHIKYLLMKKTSLKKYYTSDPQFVVLKDISEYWIIQFQEKKP